MMTGTVPRNADDGLLEIEDGCHSPHRADAPFHRSLRDEPSGGVFVRLLDRVHHLVQRDPAGRHAVGIELHLELAQIAAEPFDGGDARHGQQTVLDFELGEVAQRHEVGGAWFGFERELEDLVQPAGQARHHRRVGALRQLPRGLTDSLGDELAGAVVVGVRLELDRHLHDAELRVRPDASDVRQTGQRDFERNRDARLELLGAHRRVLHDDVEHGRRQVGEDIPAQSPEARGRRQMTAAPTSNNAIAGLANVCSMRRFTISVRALRARLRRVPCRLPPSTETIHRRRRSLGAAGRSGSPPHRPDRVLARPCEPRRLGRFSE